MDWWRWVIPLIVLGFWIFSNLAKQQQENQRRPPRPLPPPPRDPSSEDMPRPRRSPEELEKLREEFRRRQREKQRAAEKFPPLPRRSDQPPKPRPMPPPLPLEISPSFPTSTSPPMVLVVPPEPTPLPKPPAAPTVSAGKPQAASVKNVLDLLKKRENLGAAVLLREILDSPVSKRPRRR